jgi:hypothetical protein
MLFRGHLTLALGKTIINSFIVLQLSIEQGNTIILLVLHFYYALIVVNVFDQKCNSSKTYLKIIDLYIIIKALNTCVKIEDKNTTL